MFAASVGRSFRTVAGWLLERGCRVGLLEQLIGSTSVANTIAAQIHAQSRRSVSAAYIPLVLVTVWLFSPLGSQSVLRAVVVGPRETKSSATFPYLNLDNTQSIPPGGDDKGYYTTVSNTLHVAALVSPSTQRDAAIDNWGHVKIPRIESFLESPSDEEGWWAVPQSSMRASDYSSLAGIPIGRLPNTTVDLALETWYWNLECDPKSSERQSDTYHRDDFNISRDDQPNASPLLIYPLEGGNRTQHFCGMQTEPYVNSPFRIPAHCPDLPARKFGFYLSDSSGGRIIYGDCFMTTKHVEAEISCSEGRCQAKRMRPSSSPELYENVTILDVGEEALITPASYPFTSIAGLFFDLLVDMIPTKSRDFVTGNALAGAIADPDNPFRDYDYMAFGLEASIDIISRDVSNADFSNRFGQFLNTYWTYLLGWNLTTGSSDNFNTETSSGQIISPGAAAELPVKDANATVISVEDFVTCHRSWLSAFTAATIIALLCAFASLLLTFQLRGPSLVWGISTAMRDNPYILDTSSKCASYLDDDERSRIIGQTRVILADVAPRDEVGHIAISSLGTGDSVQSQRLKKGRLYY